MASSDPMFLKGLAARIAKAEPLFVGGHVLSGEQMGGFPLRQMLVESESYHKAIREAEARLEEFQSAFVEAWLAERYPASEPHDSEAGRG